MTRAEFNALNRRRLDLIDKKYHSGGLNEEESAELARVKADVGGYMAKHHPRDTSVLEDMERRVAGMKAKTKTKRSKGENDSR